MPNLKTFTSPPCAGAVPAASTTAPAPARAAGRSEEAMPHVHEVEHHPASGTGHQICWCGAARRVENGRPVGDWHACSLCVLPAFLCLLLALIFALPALAQPQRAPSPSSPPPLAQPRQTSTLFGPVLAISDGDTIRVGPAKVRLHGIDAPETSQTCTLAARPDLPPYRCGVDATRFLSRLIGSRAVFCIVLDTDRYGRLIGRCLLGSSSGMDLSRAMVAAGWAVAYRKYSSDYVPEELRARAAGLGIWRGEFQMPEDFRKAKENKR